jgi:addiction module RelE/StbE family toxin
MVRIVWTELSIQDLREVFDYIATDSNRYATITVDKIYQRVQSIASSPYIGRVVPEIDEKRIREIMVGTYRVIYKIKNDSQVDILRVYHSARLLRKEKL